MALLKSSTGTVRRIQPGPPFVLEVEVTGQGVVRLELTSHAGADAIHPLQQELLNQSVEFTMEAGEPLVFFYRTVTEDGEVESVYKVCLNSELARLSNETRP